MTDSTACPRYAGVTVKGVTVKESPAWLQDKLRLIGLRPINNVVDVTNYILHAYGQPLHCFDADKIKGGKVIVKTMPQGTPFVTLDEVERKLDAHDLMICNAEEPMCMAEDWIPAQPKLPKTYSWRVLISIRQPYVRQRVVMV